MMASPIDRAFAVLKTGWRPQDDLPEELARLGIFGGEDWEPAGMPKNSIEWGIHDDPEALAAH